MLTPSRTNPSLARVEPAFDRSSVNVVFATDQNYLPYLAVCLQSLLDHASPQRHYDICILNDGQLDLSDFPFARLRRDHVSLRFIKLDLSTYPYDFNQHLSGRYTAATYYRFFIGEVFARYPKVLYLDTDIIILHDVAELFDYDLSEKMFAAGHDCCQFLQQKKQRDYITQVLGIPFEQYFCSGVTLMNVTRMQQARVLQTALRKLDHIGVPRLVDQDILNALYHDQTVILPPVWNVMWSVFLTGTPEQVAAYRQAALPPKIIHYDSAVKPWHQPERYLANYWWDYQRQLHQ